MTLKLRASSQVKSVSVSLSNLASISSGTILGRSEDESGSGSLSAISGADVRKIAELHNDDNVQFASASLSESLTAASATLSGDLAAADANLSGDLNATGDVGGATATITGNSTIGGTLGVTSSLSADSVAISNALTAASATLSGDLAAADANLTGDLNATGDVGGATATISGNSTIGGTLSTSSSLSAASAAITNAVTAASATLSGDLAAADANLTGDLNATGDVGGATATITGNSTIGGTLGVTSSLSADSAAISNALTAASATLSGNLSAVDANLSGDLNATGDVGGATATISGNATVGGTLDATGAFTAASATLSGAMSSSSVSTSSNATIGGDMTVAGNLLVQGDSVQVNVGTLEIEDSMVKFGQGNSSDVLDLGFYGLYNDGSDKYAGLFRDQSDSGKFKLFDGITSEPGNTVVDVSSNKATLVADIEGDISYATDRTFSLSGDIAGSATFSGDNSPNISSTIQEDAVELSMIDFFLDDDNMSSDSAVHVASQQSIKAYVATKVASGGQSDLEAKDMLMVDSSGDYVKVKEITEYSLVSSDDESNDYVTVSTEIESEFAELSKIYLNGQKLRYSSDTGTNNDYWFTSTSAGATRYETALTADDPASNDFFGSGVGLSGNGLVLAVGASKWEGDNTDQGGVYIYDWDSTNEEWDQRGSVITAPDAEGLDRFGESTSLNSDGTIMATGAMFWDNATTDVGAAYVFEYANGSWSQKGSTLSHPSPTTQDYHTHVSISGNGLVLSVGVYCYDGDAGANQGATYVYDWDSSSEDWIQRSYGDSIVTNGTFASDASNWTLDDSGAGSSAVWSSDHGGSVKLTGSSGHWGWAIQTVSTTALVSGETYKLKIGVHDWTGSVGNADGDNVKNIKYGLWPKSGTNYAAAAAHAVAYPDINDVVSGTSGTIEFEFDANDDMVTDEGFKIGIFYGHLPSPTGYVYIDNVDITDENDMTITADGGVLLPTDAAASDFYGRDTSLSNDGSVLAVGSALWEGDTANQGSVYLYDWNSSLNKWVQRSYGDNIITNHDLSSGDLTGWSDESASATVEYSEYNGQDSIKLTPSNANTTEGTWAAVTNTVNYNFESGKTYKLKFDVLHYTNADRNLVYGISKVDSNGDYTGWHTGYNLDVDDAVPGESTSGEIEMEWTADADTTSAAQIRIHHGGDPLTQAGSVYVSNFRITDENDMLITDGEPVLETSSPAANDYFGFSCQLNSDATIMAVSKYQYTLSGGDEGEIELYDWNSSTNSWDLRLTISNPYGSSSGTRNPYAFGYKVSIDGDGDVLTISERGTGYDTFAGRVQTYSISSSSSENKINFNNGVISENDKLEISYIIKS